MNYLLITCTFWELLGMSFLIYSIINMNYYKNNNEKYLHAIDNFDENIFAFYNIIKYDKDHIHFQFYIQCIFYSLLFSMYPIFPLIFYYFYYKKNKFSNLENNINFPRASNLYIDS